MHNSGNRESEDMATPKTRRRSPLPQLHQFAALSTFTEFPSAKREWSLDRKLKTVKQARFVGVAGRGSLVTRKALDTHGLQFWATVDIGEVDEIVPCFNELTPLAPEKINVQMADHDTPTKTALPLARRIMQVARELELDVAIEFHRDTATETPEKRFALADAYAKAEDELLNITWDLSHFAVVKGLKAPYFERLMERPELVLKTDVFHFRPFNGHHAQIPVIDSRGRRTPEYRDWLDFTGELIRAWLLESPSGRGMWACPEMIPSGYGLSGDPPLFDQAIVVRRDLQRIWNRQVRQGHAPRAPRARARRQ